MGRTGAVKKTPTYEYGKAKRYRKLKYTGKPFTQVLASIRKTSDFMCLDSLKAVIPL
jgi:hypothetical protein